MKKILALDFDGVLHSYGSGWKGPRCIPDPPVPGAIAFLLQAMAHFDVQIFSSRSRYFGGRRAMKRWLRYHISEHLWDTEGAVAACCTACDCGELFALRADRLLRVIRFPLRKPPAHVLLDDRALTFTGTWPSLESLAAFKPWNRR